MDLPVDSFLPDSSGRIARTQLKKTKPELGKKWAEDHFRRREYDKEFPGKVLFAAGSAATGMYRGIMLWAAAVKEAKSIERATVAAALDHAKIAEGPGGPAEMVPGKRHCKMKMYTAVAKSGNYEIVEESKGPVDPKEC